MNRERIWQLVSKKLSGEVSPVELMELEELLRSDPDMHYALQNVSDIWQLPVRLPKDPEAEEVFHRHQERMRAAGVHWQEDDSRNEDQIVPTRRSSRKIILLTSI